MTHESIFANFRYKILHYFWNIFNARAIYSVVGGEIIMSNKQETLIYIEKETIAEADFMSRSFINKEVKNRAYINTLGAELVIKYLKSEGVEVENLHNIHSISKIIESVDISDIILPNIHIDVRTVFDKSQIFIPKSHFELGITPDIYVTLVLDQEFKYCELVGFFTPDQIDKNNANSQYYFIESDKLSSPETLVKYVKDFSGNTSKELTENEFFKGRELSITLADHNTTTDDVKTLLSLLMASDLLRESVIEYDNFETLAYNTVKETDLTALSPIFETSTLPQFEDIETTTETDEIQAESESESEAEADDNSETDDSQTEEEEEEVSETTEEEFSTVDFGEFETFETEENNQLDEDFFSDLTQAVEENNAEKAEASNDITFEEFSNDFENELTFDFDEPQNNDNQDFDFGKAAVDTLKTAGEAILEAGAIAAGASAVAGAAEIAAGASVTNEAIKLAGVSGEILEDLLDKNVESQQEHLNKIDYTNIDVNAEEIPEEIASIISVPTKTETDEEYVTPTDLSELQAVENPLNKEEVFEHETIDLNAMAPVQAEEIAEVSEDIINLENINFESPTKPVDNLHEILNTPKDEEGITLPDISTYSLDEPNEVEEQMLNTMTESEKHLTDFPTDLPETNLSANFEENLSLDTENLQPLSLDEELPVENLTVDMTETLSDENLMEIPSLELEDINLNEEIKDTAEPEFNFEESKKDNDDKEEEKEEPEVSLEIEDEPEELNFDTLDSLDEFQTEDFFQEETPKAEEELDQLAAETSQIEDIGEISDLETTEEFTELDEIPDFEQTDEISDIDDFSELTADEEAPASTEISDFEQTEDIISELELSELDENSDIEQTEDMLSELDTSSSIEEITDLDDFTDIETEDKIAEPELDEEFSTDLNTEFESDETLHDAEPVKELETDGIIDNPEEQIPAVLENSIVISDKTFTVGEIPIDINVVNKPNFDDSEDIGSLYNPENETAPSMLQTPGRTGKKNAPSKAGLGIIGGLLTLVVVCVIGFGVAKMFKTPTEEAPQPTTDDALPTDTIDTQVPAPDALNVDTNNVVNMDNSTDPLTTATPAPVVQNNTPPATQTAAPAAATSTKKPIPATAFLEVKKLSWEVPDYIAYNPQFKQYFQAAGRSLKLSLTTDLLLATEYAYSNEIKVTITFNKDGSFKEARVVKSSGSTQIDRIVLQTVNQTLKVLKAPHSVGNDESTTVILKIYF